MQPIDLNTWDRREIYSLFSGMTSPFYMLAFPLDVTSLYRYKKAHGISFYYALCWLCARALNSVENFRYVMRGDQIYFLDERIPSFTDMKPGSDLFYFVTPPMTDDLDAYCRNAREISIRCSSLLEPTEGNDDQIYISCIPGLDLTACTNPHNFGDPNETKNNISHITWGRYQEKDNRLILSISVEVNHCFVDGIHISRFAAELQQRIDSLKVD